MEMDGPSAVWQRRPAMESTHDSRFDPNYAAQLLLDIAHELQLLVSGGSDFHGQTRPITLLGQGANMEKIPMDGVKDLLNPGLRPAG